MVKIGSSRNEVFESALNAVELDGLILEFGVYTGKSINRIAEKFPNRTIFGFDSFRGLQENFTDKLPKGSFNLNGAVPVVAENVILIVGEFSKTLQPFFSLIEEPIAFINFDADLYSSTKLILDAVQKNIIPKTVLYFDEYYSDVFSGEYKAFKEVNIPVELIDMGLSTDKRKYSSFAFKVRESII